MYVWGRSVCCESLFNKRVLNMYIRKLKKNLIFKGNYVNVIINNNCKFWNIDV